VILHLDAVSLFILFFFFLIQVLLFSFFSSFIDPIKTYPKITLSEYGSVKGDSNIMSEIYTRGPVSAYINAECIEEYTSGVNMYDTCNTRTTNHAIQLNGWGTDENGVDYWIGRNSWGTYWGDHGFFKIVRGGAYNPGTTYWAVPKIPEF
jgi:cathepsin X